ncbi:shufflon system plasmid conjugative transfer pilus tip adhesin PilV [Ralstonia sp. ASV6]|uniref:shufflon system plasmid conjugative transfer pilus tip adhesin PilV n=1 Tax=Ralstonia sp. ASV6 TaxID=2795124 RepID=UPI0018EB3D8A|nr:shufflon system plasmid conjugative transfer pilus tip adhesin PilV [Ralstonia sp. ASV6]
MKYFSRKKAHGNQRGFLTLELIGVIGAFAVMMAASAPFIKAYYDNRQQTITADQLKLAMQGAAKFVQNNQAAISAAASPTVTYTWAQIASSMPIGLNATNSYGQTYQLAIQQIGVWPNNTLVPMVQTVGGNAIPDGELISIARMVGGSGGMISAQNPANAQGAMGSWSIALATVGANPGTGHLAGALFYDNATQTNPYLYRSAVAGQPQVNQMNTAIDMNSNNLNNAATVNAQKVVVPAGNNLQVGSAAFYGDTVNAAVRSATGGGVYAQDVNGNYTQFNAGNVVANGNTTATGNVIAGGALRAGKVGTPNAGCATNGDAVQNVDGSGQWLTCIYGVYKPIGGNLLRMGFFTANHGTGIPAPTCPLGGTRMIVVTPNNFSVDPTTVVNYGAWGAGPWTVYILDGAGSGIAGATATVGTYCGY